MLHNAKRDKFVQQIINRVELKIPFYQFARFQACPQVEPINNEVVKFYLGKSAELLETPGHTNDSVSILLNNRVAVVGCNGNTFGNQYPPFADNEKNMMLSWKALLDTQCKLLSPAHGNRLSREKLLAAYQRAVHYE